MTDPWNTREIVLDMLLEVIEGGKFSHTVLNQYLRKHQALSKQDRAFISYIFTGTVKSYLTLDYVINSYASLPVKKMKPFIRNLLRMSVYQLMYMEQVPVSAVCNEAVKLAKKRSFTKLSGFVNGILRTIARNKEAIVYPDPVTSPTDFLEIAYSTPKWLVEELLKTYSYTEVESMLAATLKEKETTIRCNTRRATPEELRALLLQEGVSVTESDYLPYAFVIRDYDFLEKLDTFHKGYFTVQDVSSMLVCEVAGVNKEDFVIDVCAAPGGKALHAAQTAGKVLARDLTEYKIKLIEENISRMGFTNVTAQVWDATVPDESLAGQADVVIADLPCSGLGVFGKKADLKYKLTQSQHKELVELQRVILDKAEKYVKPGGVLIYSTCTVLRGENEGNRNWFLQNYSYMPESLDPRLPEVLHSQTTKEGYLQLLQGVHNTDGFFIAKFRKKSGISCDKSK